MHHILVLVRFEVRLQLPRSLFAFQHRDQFDGSLTHGGEIEQILSLIHLKEDTIQIMGQPPLATRQPAQLTIAFKRALIFARLDQVASRFSNAVKLLFDFVGRVEIRHRDPLAPEIRIVI